VLRPLGANFPPPAANISPLDAEHPSPKPSHSSYLRPPMSIRFRCIRCHQLLGIADRKAGSEIECPRCGRSQPVPNKEAAEAAMLLGQITGAPRPEADPSKLVVYDDEPAAIESSRERRKKKASAAEKPAPEEKASEAKSKSQPKSQPTSQATESQTKSHPKSKTVPKGKPKTASKSRPKSEEKPGSKPGTKVRRKKTLRKKRKVQPTSRSERKKTEKPPEESLSEKSASPKSVPATESGRPLPSGMILFPRRSFYVQGVLFVLLAVIGFASGYFTGRGDANFELRTEAEAAARQTTEIKGNVFHDSGAGLVADENAVVLMLPGDDFPPAPLSTSGLGTGDDPPKDTHEPLKAIIAFGGAYCKADENGFFSMVLPDLGTYRMLVVSRQAKRPGDVKLGEVDVVEIEEYLSSAKAIIGRSKYKWTTEEITARMEPFEINFGQSGQP